MTGQPAGVHQSAVISAVASLLRRVRGKAGSPVRARRRLGVDDELPSGEGWTEWTGGACPVDPSVVVEVILWSRLGFVHQFRQASSIGWRWASGRSMAVRADNVLAFRVADPLTNQAYAEAVRFAMAGADPARDLDLMKLKSDVLGYLD